VLIIGVKKTGNKMAQTKTVSFIDAFSIPLGIFDMSDLPEIEIARNIISEYKTVEHALVPGGKSSWGVDWGSILHNPKLTTLKERVDEAVAAYAEHLGLAEVILSNSWFNIMTCESEVVPHRHERSTISGALYVDCGEGASNLFFTNPTMIYRMAEETKNHNTVYTSPAAAVQPLNGRCVLFPSWLEHGAESNDYEGRTVISFNYINLSNTKYSV
jgi:uncharacterized protein (TIGR02466 family)